MTDAMAPVHIGPRHRVLTDQEMGSVQTALSIAQLELQLLPYRKGFRWYSFWRGALFSWMGDNFRRAPLWETRFDTVDGAIKWIRERTPTEIAWMILRRGEGSHVSDNPRLVGRVPVLSAYVKKELTVGLTRERGTPEDYQIPAGVNG